MKTKQTWIFKSADRRDQLLHERFPERKCSDVPGCYYVTDGGLYVGRSENYESYVVEFFPCEVAS